MSHLEDGSEKVRVAVDAHKSGSAYGEVIELPEESKKFDSVYKKMLKSILKSLKDAIDDPVVSPRFKALKNRSGFGVLYVDSVESIRRRESQFSLGDSIDHIDRLPGEEGRHVGHRRFHEPRAGFGRRPRDVRRDHTISCLQEGILGSNRLDRDHVDGRAGQPALVEAAAARSASTTSGPRAVLIR